MKVIIKNVTIAVTLFIVLISYQNCGQVQNSMQFASSIPISNEALVCGGFDDQNSGDSFGIRGSIYVSDKTNNPGSAVKYFTQAAPLTTATGEQIVVFLNNINVPTRSFTEGFVNQNGDALKDSKDQVLIEYFGLKLDFVLKLPDDYESGLYHIAVESDDGSVLKFLDSDNQYKDFINNDGTHATQTKCAAKAIHFDHTTKIPAELYYFQGPREHIALRLVWKKVDKEVPGECKSLGVADGSASSNNWKVIPGSAFELPGSPETNPCLDQVK